MPIIAIQELRKAHIHWCEYYGLPNSDFFLDLDDDFKTFAGLHDFEPDTWVHTSPHMINVSEFAARVIRLLNSPHWHALLTAHMLRTNKPSVEETDV